MLTQPHLIKNVIDTFFAQFYSPTINTIAQMIATKRNINAIYEAIYILIVSKVAESNAGLSNVISVIQHENPRSLAKAFCTLDNLNVDNDYKNNIYDWLLTSSDPFNSLQTLMVEEKLTTTTLNQYAFFSGRVDDIDNNSDKENSPQVNPFLVVEDEFLSAGCTLGR